MSRESDQSSDETKGADVIDSAGKTEVIWDSFTRVSNQNKSLSTKESFNPEKRNLRVPFNNITYEDYDKKSLVVWEKVPIDESYSREEIRSSIR